MQYLTIVMINIKCKCVYSHDSCDKWLLMTDQSLSWLNNEYLTLIIKHKWQTSNKLKPNKNPTFDATNFGCQHTRNAWDLCNDNDDNKLGLSWAQRKNLHLFFFAIIFNMNHSFHKRSNTRSIISDRTANSLWTHVCPLWKHWEIKKRFMSLSLILVALKSLECLIFKKTIIKLEQVFS